MRMLQKHLMDIIKISGPISIAHYMRLCLTHPIHGYYMNQDVFGREGDFITSPEISQLFGEMVGIWCISEWIAAGKPHNVSFVELGPGRGTLAADILRTLKQFHCKPQSIQLVEASPFLMRVQAKALESYPVSWYNSINNVPVDSNFKIMIAHEFFDALPIHAFKNTEKGWREIMEFHYVLSPNPTPASILYMHGKEGDIDSIVEVSPESTAIMMEMQKRLSKFGCGMVIDYGGMVTNKQSLRGISKQKFVSVFDSPGDIDLSADVNFGTLKRECKDIGAFGPVTQREFLLAMGIQQRLEILLKNATAEEAFFLKSGCNRLINDMGSIYKVLALSNNPTPIAVT